MEKSKVENPFVTLSKCKEHFCSSDIICNFCKKSICNFCKSMKLCCRICETVTCQSCHFEGSGVCTYCKEGREGKRDVWIEYAKELYNGKIFKDHFDLSAIEDQFVDEKIKKSEIRMKAIRDTLCVWVKEEKYGSILYRFRSDIIPESFPTISEFVQTGGEKLQFKQFLQRMLLEETAFVVSMWLHGEDGELMFDLVKDFLKENPRMVNYMLKLAMKRENGGWLVKMLVESFNPDVLFNQSYVCYVKNVPAVDLCLKKGLDLNYVDKLNGIRNWCVMNNNMIRYVVLREERFLLFFFFFFFSFFFFRRDKDVKVMLQHLISRGASIDSAIIDVDAGPSKFISHPSLEVILKKKGDEFIHQIPLNLLLPYKYLKDVSYRCYKMIRTLRKLKYNIPKDFIRDQDVPVIVCLMCCGYIKFEELSEKRRKHVASWIRCNDVKVNSYTLPFLCDDIKERMLMFLLCVNRTVGHIGKDLKMTLLDWIWSPMECRGD